MKLTDLTKAKEKITQLADPAKEKFTQMAGSAGEKMSQLAGSAGEKVSRMAGSAGEKVSRMAGSAGEKVSRMAGSAGEKITRLTDRVNLHREDPLWEEPFEMVEVPRKASSGAMTGDNVPKPESPAASGPELSLPFSASSETADPLSSKSSPQAPVSRVLSIAEVRTQTQKGMAREAETHREQAFSRQERVLTLPVIASASSSSEPQAVEGTTSSVKPVLLSAEETFSPEPGAPAPQDVEEDLFFEDVIPAKVRLAAKGISADCPAEDKTVLPEKELTSPEHLPAADQIPAQDEPVLPEKELTPLEHLPAADPIAAEDEPSFQDKDLIPPEEMLAADPITAQDEPVLQEKELVPLENVLAADPITAEDEPVPQEKELVPLENVLAADPILALSEEDLPPKELSLPLQAPAEKAGSSVSSPASSEEEDIASRFFSWSAWRKTLRKTAGHFRQLSSERLSALKKNWQPPMRASREDLSEEYEEADRSGKPKSLTGARKPAMITAASLAGLVLLASGSFLISHRGRETFFERTYLQNSSIAGLKPEEVARRIIEKRNNLVIVLMENGMTTASGRAWEFGYQLDEDALLQALFEAQESQRQSTSAAFSSLVQSSDLSLEETWTCDTETLNRKINSRNLKIKRTASQDAGLLYSEEDKKYVLKPEVNGNQFKASEMQAWVRSALDEWFAEASSEDMVCRLEIPDSLYRRPAVLQDSPALLQELDALNAYADSEVVYTFGSQEQILDFNTFHSWLSYEDGLLHWNTSAMKRYIEDMASIYNTRGIGRDFITSSGDTVHFNAALVDYGYTINEESELAQLTEDLMSKETVTREPVYYQTNRWGDPVHYSREGVDDLNGTYIEVSIGDQYVWFYKNGELIVETNCVTGNVAKEMDTHVGMYSIASKASPAILRGGEGDGAYETPVQYWMPFNGGEGLHDAQWRGNFGGSIYKTHGSHGCVNLPLWAAAEIYQNCKSGMAVIVY